MKAKATKPQAKEIGWRETVGLPELDITAIKAKIDTGARTSALHAVDVEPLERDGLDWVRFHVPSAGKAALSFAPVLDRRMIKNTSGVEQERFVIETVLVLGRRHWHVELSLADRENMEFDLILGRTAMRRHKLLVNPGRSFLAGPPKWQESS